MTCGEIIAQIEKDYPTSCALEWDNVGLLAGRMDKEVKRVYIGLDATDSRIRGRIFFLPIIRCSFTGSIV